MLEIKWPGKGGAWTFPVTSKPVFYLTPIWCPRKKVTTAVNKIKMKKATELAMQSRSSGRPKWKRKGNNNPAVWLYSTFQGNNVRISIFAGQLPRGLWKQFRREIKRIAEQISGLNDKMDIPKTDFTELITGWLRLSHINKLKRSKNPKESRKFERI